MDGVFAAVQFGLTDQFITPLALLFGANNFAIGFLSFVRNSLVSIVQFYSADITKRLGSRKKTLMFSVLVAGLMWIPTYFLPFLFGGWRVAVFIILFAVTSCFNLLATPAWASLVSQYVPPSKRGQYFGFRGSTLGLIYFVSLLSGGLLLHVFESIGLFAGFAILICTASTMRLISWYFITKMYEPPWHPEKSADFSFADFVKRIRVSNFTRFAVFCGWLMFAVAIVSPFFAVYLLKEVGFGYVHYTFLMGATILTTYATQRYWGIFADKFGNFKIITLSAVLISFIPFLWLFTRSFYYLMLIQLLAGFLWAGYNLSTVNFIFDAAVTHKRERCVSYYNFLSGLGLGAGALIGGLFYQFLPHLWGSNFYFLLIISGMLRLVFAACLFFAVKEVRTVQPVRPHMLLLDIAGFRAMGMLGKELVVGLKKVRPGKAAKVLEKGRKKMELNGIEPSTS